MHRRSAGLLAASALGASALILPPGIAPASNDHEGALPSIVNPKNQLIELPCPSCAFSPDRELLELDKDRDDLAWIQGGSNNVVLDFSLSQDGSALELGGKPIYAPQSQTNALLSGEPLYVHQMPTQHSARKVPLEITGVGLSTEAEVRASPEGDVIVQLQLRIMSIEGHFMQFDGVRIHLLISSAGELLILRLDIVPDTTFTPFPGLTTPPPSSPPTMDMPHMEDCKSLPLAFCRFREMIEAKVSSMRQSHHGPPVPLPDFRGPPPPPLVRPSINPHHLDFDAPPPHHHGRPHHGRPHGSHHYHSFGGTNSFMRSVISILIPVMAGITVGLLVSLLGLLVGRMVGFCWLRIYPNSSTKSCRRRRSRRSRRRSLAAEGKILLTEDDPETLPAYEDAPAYEEVETLPR